jgi:hypothetical protein
MAVREVTLAELGPHLGRMLRFATPQVVVKAIQNAVFLHAPRIIQEEIAMTEPHEPVDRGTYKAAWTAEPVENGARIYNPLPYAAVIEHGRRPGKRQPPPGVLVDWIRRKDFRHESGRDLTAAEVRGLAYVIGKKIAEKGVPGKKILERSMERLEPLILDEIRKAVEAQL